MPEFEILVEKFLRDELPPAGIERFLRELEDPVNREKLRRIVTEKLQQKEHTGLSDEGTIDLMFQQMLAKAAGYESPGITPGSTSSASEIPPSIRLPKKYISVRRLAAIAAVLLLLVGVGVQLWIHRSSQQPMIAQKQIPVSGNDVEPGGNKAVLTLSDGSKINLNGADNGVLAQQGSTKVVKLAGGQLAYHTTGPAAKEILYNTMSTPRGGQYQLTLPDGTRVWLNASSSITYPTAFSGKERKVVMSGEAYFEVTARPLMPFKVMTKDVEVNVVGTHFNVNAYADESSVSTTLLEGAVKVSAGNHLPMLIKPGQQAVYGVGSGLSLVEDADIEESIAWKEGLFSFNGADLPSIMRQLARWYDLDVRYEGPISKRRFTGKVFRNLKLSETLNVLELNHIHFRIEGNRVVVMP